MSKEKRLKRLFMNNRTVMFPIDHGITLGPVEGLIDIEETLNEVLEYVDVVIANKGVITKYEEIFSKRELGLIMHISGSINFSPNSNYKIQTATVEEAVALGCDGVSIHVNIGDIKDAEMLKIFSAVSTECTKYGMPLLCMIYQRGKNVDTSDLNIKHMARVAFELGADIVKVQYTDDEQFLRDIANGAQIPVVIAGGDIDDNAEFNKKIAKAINAGISGVAVGRNLFNTPIDKMKERAKDIYSIVHFDN